MLELIPGQNTTLAAGARQASIRLTWTGHTPVQVRCALLDNALRLPNTEHLGPAHDAAGHLDLLVDLAGVPAGIGGIGVWLAAPDLAAVAGLRVQVSHPHTGPVAEFAPVLGGLGPGSGVTLIQVYRRNGQWKVRAEGQGVADGFAGLAQAFVANPPSADAAPDPGFLQFSTGISLAKQQPATDPPEDPAGRQTSTTGAQSLNLGTARAATDGWVPPALLSPVHLPTGRVVLGKQRRSLHVPIATGTDGLDMRLTWAPASRPSRTPGPDLHLGALWHLSTGLTGAVQSLGGHRTGPARGHPVLTLAERDETHGEVLHLDLSRAHALHRLIVYVYAYSGRPQWARLRPVLTTTFGNAAKVEIRIDDVPSAATICAAMSIHRVRENLVLRQEAEFLRGQQSSVATAYGFDLGWTRNR